jgi:hypothetical protein
VLAFFSGGYFDVPRLWAALGMWVGVSAIALLAPQRLPASGPALCALGGLLAFAALAFASAWWAPRRGPAFDDAGRDLLYLAALIAAAALLRGPVARAAEPALAAGATIVIGYGLSERLLPGLVTLSHSRTAFGRLEQPLTYWNATGALAAIGLVLALRVAGDPERRAALRSAAIAAAVPLGAGLALSYSRGALLAAVAGLVVLVALAPETVWTAALGSGAALLAGVAVSIPDGVRTLAGTTTAQGGVVLVVLLALMGAAVMALRRVRPARGLRIGGAAAAGIVAGLVGLVLLGAALDRGPRGAGPAEGATAQRLASTQSNRYAYWRVAVRGFTRHPVRGVGGGGFAEEWLHERTVRDPARDAHSLYVETAAEYGLVGLACLGLVFGGVAVAAGRARRRAPALTVGAIAGLAAWAVHAGVDWDWEMPALTLVAVLLAGLLFAAAEEEGRRPPRVLLALPAVAIAALVAVGLRAAMLTEEGRGLVPTRPVPLSDAQFAHARSVLGDAQRLEPDPEPKLLEAVLLVNRRQFDESIRLLDEVVAAEPRNAQAWAVLAAALEIVRSPRAPAARARARELAPRVVR